MNSSKSGGPWTKPYNLILTSAVFSCGLVVSLFVLLQQTLMPWRFRYIQAETVAIGGSNGQGQIILSTQLDGLPIVIIKGPSGRQSLTMGIGQGRPFVNLLGPSGNTTMAAELDAGGSPVIRMMNPATGSVTWEVTLDANGMPVVTP